MRIVFMGTPAFAVPALEQLLLNRYEVVAVYTQPDRPAGRGRALIASPVKEAALKRQLTVVQPARLKTPEALEQLAGFHPDLIIVAAFGQLLPQSVLDLPAYGCVNIHPSLLPKCRGASPVAAAILSGEEFTGVSIMLLDAGMDTGPVLVQAAVPVGAQDNTGTLTAKLAEVGARLLQEALAGWLRHEISPRPQNEAEATYSALVNKEEGLIDWKMPAADIWRRVRAYNPWPMSYTTWRGRQLKILEAAPMPGTGVSGVGRVVGADSSGTAAGVVTGAGVLKLISVQLEGKKAMTAGEFLRGQRGFINAVLPD